MVATSDDGLSFTTEADTRLSTNTLMAKDPDIVRDGDGTVRLIYNHGTDAGGWIYSAYQAFSRSPSAEEQALVGKNETTYRLQILRVPVDPKGSPADSEALALELRRMYAEGEVSFDFLVRTYADPASQENLGRLLPMTAQRAAQVAQAGVTVTTITTVITEHITMKGPPPTDGTQTLTTTDYTTVHVEYNTDAQCK